MDVDRINDFNFLGLIINEHLNLKAHRDKDANSIFKTIDILNVLKHSLPRTLKTTLFNSLISHKLLPTGYENVRIKKCQKGQYG